jgi:hypothetical protein
LKLSKTSYMVIVLGIVASVFAVMWVMRGKQVQEQERLYDELSVATMMLDKVKSEEGLSQQEGLETQISQILSQLETAKATLSQSANSIAVSGTLFDMAGVAGVEITNLSSAPHSAGDWEGVAFSVLPVTVTVEGDVPGILSFISSLNRDLNAAVINSAVITIPEATSEEKPSADIQLSIYTYQGG